MWIASPTPVSSDALSNAMYSFASVSRRVFVNYVCPCGYTLETLTDLIDKRYRKKAGHNDKNGVLAYGPLRLVGLFVVGSICALLHMLGYYTPARRDQTCFIYQLGFLPRSHATRSHVRNRYYYGVSKCHYYISRRLPIFVFCLS